MHRRREDHSCGTLTARAVIHLAFNVSNLVGFRVVREEIEILPSCELPELHTYTVALLPARAWSQPAAGGPPVSSTDQITAGLV